VKVTYSNKRRGFQDLALFSATDPADGLSIRESSAIGDYEDSFDIPGSSSLYIGVSGNESAYDREEVASVIDILQWWLDSGRLPDADQLAEFDDVEVAQ
jgi:hypothetical protein